MKMRFVALVLGVFLIGCGTTSNSTNDAINNNFTILKGTVPGTLIELFCDDGVTYTTNSILNATAEHPFEVTVPKGLNCRLVMTTHEDDIHTKVVTPIRIVSSEGNSTVFKGVQDIADLGYVALALNRNDIIDANGDGVSDVTLDVEERSGALAVVHLDVDPLDDDQDGIVNIYEDDDNDGLSNHDDDDDDNDGIKDTEDDIYDSIEQSHESEFEQSDKPQASETIEIEKSEDESEEQNPEEQEEDTKEP